MKTKRTKIEQTITEFYLNESELEELILAKFHSKDATCTLVWDECSTGGVYGVTVVLKAEQKVTECE